MSYVIFFFAMAAFYIVVGYTGPYAQWCRYMLGLSEENKKEDIAALLWKNHKDDIIDSFYIGGSLFASLILAFVMNTDLITPIAKFIIAVPVSFIPLSLLCWRIHFFWANRPK